MTLTKTRPHKPMLAEWTGEIFSLSVATISLDHHHHNEMPLVCITTAQMWTKSGVLESIVDQVCCHAQLDPSICMQTAPGRLQVSISQVGYEVTGKVTDWFISWQNAVPAKQLTRNCLFEQQLAAAAAVYGFFRGFGGGTHAQCIMSNSRIAAVDSHFI